MFSIFRMRCVYRSPYKIPARKFHTSKFLLQTSEIFKIISSGLSRISTYSKKPIVFSEIPSTSLKGEDLVNFFLAIVKKNPEHAQRILCKFIDMPDMEDHNVLTTHHMNLEQFLRLASFLIPHTKEPAWFVNYLVRNFYRIPIIYENFNQRREAKDLFQLFKQIVTSGIWQTVGLYDSGHLNLEKLSPDQQFQIIQSIAHLGRQGVDFLSQNLTKLNFDFNHLTLSQIHYFNEIFKEIDLTLYKVLKEADEFCLRGMAEDIIRELICTEMALNQGPLAEIKMDPDSEMIPLIDVLNLTNHEILFHDGIMPKEVYKAFESYFQGPLNSRYLKDLFFSISREPDPFKQFKQCQWLSFTTLCMWNLTSEEQKLIFDSGKLQDIYELPSPQDRYILTRHLQQLKNKGEMQSAPVSNNARGKLAGILLQRLTDFGALHETTKKLHQLIDAHAGFKESKHLHVLFNLLHHVLNTLDFKFSSSSPVNPKLTEDLKDKLKTQEKIQMFCLFLLDTFKSPNKQNRPIKELLDDLDCLSNLLELFGKNSFFKALEDKSDIKVLFDQKFCQLFHLSDISDVSLKYQNTFKQFRNKSAIFTYLKTLSSLPVEETNKCIKALGLYVRSVLNNEFQALRYDPANNRHLKSIFESDPMIKEQWLEKQSVPFTFVKSKSDFDAIHFFTQKIITDRHLNPEDFSFLTAYLQDRTEEVEPKIKDDKWLFQKHAIALCKSHINVPEFLSLIRQLKIDFKEFQNDLKSLSKHAEAHKFVITETDDPCDLLLLGTEIHGSCLRVSGDAQNNRGLIGYLMDGTIRPIVIKNLEGNLVARSNLWLLKDQMTNRPLIFLERIYSNFDDRSFEKAIINYAIAKAEKMQIPLLSYETKSKNFYPNPLLFLGGNSPYVYSDTKRGVMPGRKPFTISESYLIT